MSVRQCFGADISTYLGPSRLFGVQYSAPPEAVGYIAEIPALVPPNKGPGPSHRHQAFHSPVRKGYPGMVHDPFEKTSSLQPLLDCQIDILDCQIDIVVSTMLSGFKPRMLSV